MQDLWASVLGGESNSPGSYSKRTVNFLGDLDKKDAELFVAICRFGWIFDFDYLTPLIFDFQASIYNDVGINFGTLNHLDSVGLIKFDSFSGFSLQGFPKKFAVSYYGQPLSLVMKNEKDNKLTIGKVLLTQVGRELASVCQAQRVDGFVDYVKEQWKQFLPETENT